MRITLCDMKVNLPTKILNVVYIHAILLICPHDEYPINTRNPPVMITLLMENLLHKMLAIGPVSKKIIISVFVLLLN